MANDPVETVPLGYGLTLACSFPDLDAVEVAISFLNRRLVCHRFSAKERGAPHRFDLGLVRFEIGISANMFDGEVTLTCGAEIRKALGSAWHRVFKGERRIRFDPSIGEVAGRTEAAPPELTRSTFGPTQACSPTVLRFHVDQEEREVCKVGSIVKRVMFPDYPPFVFNTVACVGAFSPPGAPGPYADPTSECWFNVFFGYYQLDCLKSEWSRPFGYATADRERSTVVVEDLVRLGKSDWNWFSNWCYGVPWDALVLHLVSPRVDRRRRQGSGGDRRGALARGGDQGNRGGQLLRVRRAGRRETAVELGRLGGMAPELRRPPSTHGASHELRPHPGGCGRRHVLLGRPRGLPHGHLRRDGANRGPTRSSSELNWTQPRR